MLEDFFVLMHKRVYRNTHYTIGGLETNFQSYMNGLDWLVSSAFCECSSWISTGQLLFLVLWVLVPSIVAMIGVIVE